MQRKYLSLIFFLALALLVLPGALPAASPVSFTVGEFTFDRPSEWAWIETESPMRQAHLQIQGEEEEVADIAFFYFGEGQGGGVDANIGRWFGQFQESIEEIDPRVEQLEISGTPVHFVQARGTYNTAMPGLPPVFEPGIALYGAILESPRGDVFIRLTGPIDLVKANGDAFRAFVEEALNGGGY